MKFKHFIGIDVSKLTLDFCILKGSNYLVHERIENKKSTILQLLKKLKVEYKVQGKSSLFCTESTGPYQNTLLSILQTKKTHIWVESGLTIKRSLGIQRGRSDKIDSFRIAHFAYLNRETPKLWQAPRDELVLLKKLNSLRRKLKLALFRLQVSAYEEKGFISKELFTQLDELYKPSANALKNDIARIEEKMESIIESDAQINHLMKILVSVPGIGHITALELIIVTNEFKNFASPKRLASFCGIAPFEYTSGTSIKGKTRVSKLANKQLKGLLHMGALATIRNEGELRQYYVRKIGQGKHKMSVLNTLKNKIIHRAFACVKSGRPYQAGNVGPIVPLAAKVEYPQSI